MSHYCCSRCNQRYEYCTCKSSLTSAGNIRITPEEIRGMTNFMLVRQRSIAEDIFEKYNTNHEDGIKSALKEAAFQGYLEGYKQGSKEK